MPKDPKATHSRSSSRNSPVPPVPSLSRGSSSQNELKVPLIRWDKHFAQRTTRLIAWFKENDAARLKLFSDSTQDAKDSNCRKEVSGRSRSYYYSEAAKAIFANDDDLDVRHCSQVRPDLFAMKIDRRIKDLWKAYSAENKKLGQTGVGMTYEELQSDPSKSNILTSIIKSFPWWPDLHGFWWTNPGFNMSPAVADQDQDLEQEALSLFRLGNLASDASSANETDSGLNSIADSPHPFDTNSLPLVHDDPGLPILDTTSFGDDFFSSFFNMDLDDAFDTSLPPLLPSNNSLQDLSLTHDGGDQDVSSVRPHSSHAAPPPLLPSKFSLQDLSLRFSSYTGDQNTSSIHSLPPFAGHSHPFHSRTSRSPVPFAFRGGAPCILPPPTTGNVISLNSDDKSDNPIFKYQSHLHQKVCGSDSSHPSKHSAQILYSHSSDGSKPAPTLSTPPTSVHDNASSSAASGSCQPAGKGKRAQASPAISASERLVMQADDLITKGASMAESFRNDRARRRDAHYQNKEAERAHQQWLAQFNADHKKDMAKLKLQQLERELELERLRHSAN